MSIKEAIQLAEAGKSGLSKEVIGSLKGMSSPHIWHLLNNLVQGPYLEVGVWKGSTLTAALTGKDIPAWAIDNFSQFGDVQEEFYRNTRHLSYTFIQGDCFSACKAAIDQPIEFYLYDGAHTEDDHFKALVHFYPDMAEEFIYMVDDWNVLDVQSGTYRAIEAMRLNVVEQHERLTPKNGCKDSWWNGFAVFRLKRTV